VICDLEFLYPTILQYSKAARSNYRQGMHAASICNFTLWNPPQGVRQRRNSTGQVINLTETGPSKIPLCGGGPGLLARIFHELLSRDHEDGRATGQPSRGTAGLVRGVPERHVAGADTRGRQEGRPYPWSQQVIHEISGLGFNQGQFRRTAKKGHSRMETSWGHKRLSYVGSCPFVRK
jgi:hypothetical protein